MQEGGSLVHFVHQATTLLKDAFPSFESAAAANNIQHIDVWQTD